MDKQRSIEIASRFRFRGEVQGVGFRFATLQLAETLGLRGWVRNEPDGSVTALFQGSVSDIQRIVASLNERFEILETERISAEIDTTLSGFQIAR
ncbi:MAG: acylphosphatase [Pirellulaceae bacterium]